MKIKVSVIVPVYNVAPYLPRCMDSLINQTLKDIEIICVDDCSTDNSWNIMEDYAEKDNRIKIIKQSKNQGAYAARQTGLNVATGEYIGFVDSDDYVELDFFEKLYELAKSENADIAKGAVIEQALDGTRKTLGFEFNDVIAKDKLKFMGQYLWNAIYKTDVIRKNNIEFHIDIFCFGIQMAYFANKILTRNDAFSVYVRRADSCDSEYFSLHKWQWWNVRGANYYLSFLNSHNYEKQDYINIVSGFIYPLYFYGFDRLESKDFAQGSELLTGFLLEFYKELKYKEDTEFMFGKYLNAVKNKNKKELKKLLLKRHKTSFLKRLKSVIKPKKQIKAVQLAGGLANQMFQYAFGIAAGTNLYDFSWFEEIKKSTITTIRVYEMDIFNVDVKKIKSAKLKSVPKINEYNWNGYQPELLIQNGLICGYFQNEKYLNPVRDKLIKDFSLKKPLISPLLDEIKSENSVSIHVRRGDYLKSAARPIVGIEYCKTAMGIIEKEINNPHYYVFSDDPDWVCENIKSDKKITFISGNPDYIDLELMKNCKHNIIANSSFSWMAAYLNQNPEKIVIYPKIWTLDKGEPFINIGINKNWVSI